MSEPTARKVPPVMPMPPARGWEGVTTPRQIRMALRARAWGTPGDRLTALYAAVDALAAWAEDVQEHIDGAHDAPEEAE